MQTIAVDSVSVKDILLVARPHEQKEADLPLTDSDEEVVSEKNAISNEVLFARQDFSAKINDVSKLWRSEKNLFEEEKHVLVFREPLQASGKRKVDRRVWEGHVVIKSIDGDVRRRQNEPARQNVRHENERKNDRHGNKHGNRHEHRHGVQSEPVGKKHNEVLSALLAWEEVDD